MNGGGQTVKTFVATARGQGHRDTDLFRAEEGELVLWPLTCPLEPIDGPCGCRRSMLGIYSGGMTSTFTIADVRITRRAFAKALRDAMDRAGLLAGLSGPAAERALEDHGRRLVFRAMRWPAETLLERRGERILPRELHRPLPWRKGRPLTKPVPSRTQETGGNEGERVSTVQARNGL